MQTRLSLLIVAMLMSQACQHVSPSTFQHGAQEFVCSRASSPIHVDGKLDEEAWRQAIPLAFDIPRDQQQQGLTLEEKGTGRVLWDDQYLYVAFDFVDSDVVANGTEDDQEHHNLGDVAEIFLKPTDQTWYWEFHVTRLDTSRPTGMSDGADLVCREKTRILNRGSSRRRPRSMGR